MGMYVSMLPEHTSYKESGPRGETQLIKQANLTMPTLRGSTVFEIEAFDTDFSGVPVNQLERARQCGEYFEFDTKMNTTETGSIYIYSADSDDFEKIDYKYAADRAWNSKKLNTDKLVLFRPHQTWNMNSAILCESGEALGYTFHGNHSFLLQTDSLRKLHIGHYTYYSRSVVHDEKRMRLMEDIFCTGYVGGEGHEFYEDLETYDNAGKQSNMGKMGSPSLIALWLPEKLWKSKTNIDMRDAEIVKLMQTGKDGEVDQNKSIGGLDSNGFGETNNMEYTADYTVDNSVCFRSMQYTKMKDDDKPVITSINHGHWGPNIYPRCKNHRIGLTGCHIKEQGHKKSMI